MLPATNNTKPSRVRRQPSLDFQTRSKVTYGKRIKLLPLRGTHFMRSSPYDIPADVPRYETPVQRRYRPVPSPDDSPLSEEKLEAVYGKSKTGEMNVSPGIESPSNRASFERTSGAQSPRTSSPSMRQGPGNVTRPFASMPEGLRGHKAAPKKGFLPKSALKEGGSKPRAKTAVITTAPPQSSKDTSISAKPRARRQIVQSGSVTPHVSRRRFATPVRRLPFDELFMLPELPELPDYLRPPDSSFAGILKQDPITDSSSSAQKLMVPKKEIPLTSIRKRLKTPNFTHKSTSTLRKKQNDQKTTRVRSERNLGDGFDSTELKARPCRAKKQRRDGTILIRGLGALQLLTGPLPDVKFAECKGVLKAELPHEDPVPNHGGGAEQTNSGSLAERKSDRRVTFSDTFFDEATRAQLSSVSAPKRVFEVSSDESEQEDDEEEEEEEDDDDDDDDDDDGEYEHAERVYIEKDFGRSDANGDAGLGFDIPSVKAAVPTSFQRLRASPLTESRVEPNSTPLEVVSYRKPGVTLDFRKSATPSFATQSSRKQRQMEVDESIIDDLLVEDTEILSAAASREHRHTLDHQRAEKEASGYHVGRPHSILRSSTPIRYNQNVTRSEDTIANTRRNSNIAIGSPHFSSISAVSRMRRGMAIEQLAQAVPRERTSKDQPEAAQKVFSEAATRRRKTTVTLEPENASYFGVASRQLRGDLIQPTRRMNSRPDAAASHFFQQRRREADIQVLGSSRAVLETSPHRKVDFVAELSLGSNIVRRDEARTQS